MGYLQLLCSLRYITTITSRTVHGRARFRLKACKKVVSALELDNGFPDILYNLKMACHDLSVLCQERVKIYKFPSSKCMVLVLAVLENYHNSDL